MLALTALLALAPVLAGDGLAPAPVLATGAAAEVAAVLRASRDPEAPPAVELSRQVAALGCDAIAPILDVLLARRVPAVLPEQTEQLLSVPQRRILFGALEELDGSDLRTQVSERLLDAPTERERETAVWVLGAIGTAADLDQVVQQAHLERDGEPVRGLARPLSEACTSILARDADAYRRLVVVLRRVPDHLQPALIEAVGEARDPRGLSCLVEAVRWDADLVRLALAQVSRVGRSPDPAENAALAELVRADLDPARLLHPRETMLALGTLWDWESVPRLVELTRAPSAELRESAHWALCRMTGLTLPCDGAVWARWYATELEWDRRERVRTGNALGSSDLDAVARALRSLRDHRLYRDQLAELVQPLLEHRLPAVRAGAADALVSLGLPIAPAAE